MTSDINPYQSFAAESGPVAAEVAGQGLWRQGKLLVIEKTAELPYVCIKSNEPADGRLTRKLTWHHPLISVSILASPIIYIILAAILSKRATIHIGLSDAWFAKRRTRIVIAWLLSLGGFGALVSGIVLMNNIQMQNTAPLLMFGGFIAFIVGIIYGLVAGRLVTPDKITDHHVWLKGVHPEFLAGLPEWPHY